MLQLHLSDQQFYCLIYVIITKNIRYLLGNQRVWRFFHGTYLTIEVQGIWYTNHLHDSCPLTDVNPHFTAPRCRYYFKIYSWWHMGQSLAIVTSQWPIVPTGIYGHMMLRSAPVEGIAITCEALSCLAHDFITLHIVVEWFIMAHWETKQFIHILGYFVYFTYHFRTPVFQHGASLVLHVLEVWQ